MRTFSYCKVMFCTKCGSKIGNEYYFCSTCGHKTRSELTDSVPLQFQDSICEKDIIRNYFQAGYHYEVIVMFLRLYHNINISKRTLERRRSYYGFRKRGFSNVTINELKNDIVSEIKGLASMRGYRGLWYSLKTNYGIIVQRDIVMNILKEINPEVTNMRKACRLHQRKYVSEGPNSCWHADGYDKLKTYGFPIHGCIDRYSKRILWLKVTKSNLHAKVPAAYYVDTTGARPEIFQGRGGFVKLGHFNKHFVKNSRKKEPAGKIS